MKFVPFFDAVTITVIIGLQKDGEMDMAMMYFHIYSVFERVLKLNLIAYNFLFVISREHARWKRLNGYLRRC